MAFQSTVNFQQSFGIVGESAFEGPRRAQPGILASASAANNVVGRAFTIVSGATGSWDTNPADPKPLTVQAGNPAGTAIFAGIFAAPKNYASPGTTAGGTLAPTLTLPNGFAGEFVTMDEIIVNAPAGTSPGDVAYMTNATGVITFTAPGAAAPAASTLIPNATVKHYTNVGASLAVLKLTN